MTEYHEGQEVEVEPLSEMFGAWRKARIVRSYLSNDEFGPRKYEVEFADGTRGAFDTIRIRALLEEVIEDIAKLLPE
jgi:hypothetical protein